MAEGTEVERQMQERIPFLPEHPLSKTHIARRSLGKKVPYIVRGIPKRPSDECEDIQRSWRKIVLTAVTVFPFSSLKLGEIIVVVFSCDPAQT